MHAVIDAPSQCQPVDPHRFSVRGWIWVGANQADVNRVELWSGSVCLGRGESFYDRPDVNQALGLPAGARVGFEFFAHCPTSAASSFLKMGLRIGWRDGALTDPVIETTAPAFALGIRNEYARSRPVEPTHLARTSRWLRRQPHGKDFGVEIGAFKTPTPGINPLYLDRFPAYGYEEVKADYFADALSLPVKDDSLDYVANANVFEHLANPVKGLLEWARALRDGGIIYLVIPDRRLTFDRNRALTAPEHIIADFDAGTTDADPTHVTEYIDGVDWSLWVPDATPAERSETREKLRAAYSAAVAVGEPINIHFHTFELKSFVELLALVNKHPRRLFDLELVDASEYFPASHPSGFLAVIRVRKGALGAVRGALWRISARGDAHSVLFAGAQTFESYVRSRAAFNAQT